MSSGRIRSRSPTRRSSLDALNRTPQMAYRDSFQKNKWNCTHYALPETGFEKFKNIKAREVCWRVCEFTKYHSEPWLESDNLHWARTKSYTDFALELHEAYCLWKMNPKNNIWVNKPILCGWGDEEDMITIVLEVTELYPIVTAHITKTLQSGRVLKFFAELELYPFGWLLANEIVEKWDYQNILRFTTDEDYNPRSIFRMDDPSGHALKIHDAIETHPPVRA